MLVECKFNKIIRVENEFEEDFFLNNIIILKGIKLKYEVFLNVKLV